MIAEQAWLLYTLVLPHFTWKGRADNTRASLYIHLNFEAFFSEGHHKFFPVIVASDIARITVGCGCARCITTKSESLQMLTIEAKFHLVRLVVSAHEVHIVGLQIEFNPIFAVNREHVLDGGSSA